MEFHCTEIVKYPLALAWETLRDHLPQIAAAQDDIKYVKIKKRDKKDPAAHHVISTWQADPPLPSFLMSFIKPDMLIWTDDAVWDNTAHQCHFTITPNYKVEDIQCRGHIKLESTNRDKSTRIIYTGVLTIKKTSRSSIFMTGFIIKGIEAVASRLIAHNFSKTVRELEKLMNSG
jgi:hypothetical protein